MLEGGRVVQPGTYDALAVQEGLFHRMYGPAIELRTDAMRVFEVKRTLNGRVAIVRSTG